MIDFTLDTAPIAIPFQQAVNRLEEIGFADALWARRLDVWTNDAATQAKIANRLGWLNAIEFVRPHVGRLRAFADAIRQEAFTDVVLLGMGGSSLAPEVMRRVIGVAPGCPRFRVLDSVDPDAVRDAMANAGTSLFLLASKSGSTIEPNVMAAEAQRRLREAGIAHWGSRFVAITDEGTPAHHRAQAERFRDIFINPSDIGGRYSALSFFGMVPAALMGIDLDAMLTGASGMAEACRRRGAPGKPGARSWRLHGGRGARGAGQAHTPGPGGARLVRPVGRATRGGEHREGGKRRDPDRRGALGRAPRTRSGGRGGHTLATEAPRGVERAAAAGAPLIRIDHA